MLNIKKTILLFNTLVIGLFSFAQSNSLTIGMVLPKTSEDISENAIKKIESKMAQLLSNSSEVTMGTQNDFILVPKITIDETKLLEGGLENLTVSTIEFTLFVKQITSGIVYGSISKKLKGTGENKNKSIYNAFNQINTSDEIYNQFIKNAKQKILKYYEENCNKIIQESNAAAALKNYEKSIALVQSIPYGAKCYDQAQKKAIETYQKYQSTLCVNNITKAKASLAINDYASAIYYLYQIDPAANCNAEVNKLIAQVSSKYDKFEARQNDLEKVRINAIKEIGKAYYSQQVTSYSLILF